MFDATSFLWRQRKSTLKKVRYVLGNVLDKKKGAGQFASSRLGGGEHLIYVIFCAYNRSLGESTVCFFSVRSFVPILSLDR